MSGIALLAVLFVLFLAALLIGTYCHFHPGNNHWLPGHGSSEIPQAKTGDMTGDYKDQLNSTVISQHSPVPHSRTRKEIENNLFANYGGDEGFSTFDHMDKLNLAVAGEPYRLQQVGRNEPLMSLLFS